MHVLKSLSFSLFSMNLGEIIDSFYLLENPKIVLESIASKAGHNVDSLEFAKFLDENDHLKDCRSKFHCKEDVLYFCGNSLGLPPKKAKDYLDEVYNNWVDL